VAIGSDDRTVFGTTLGGELRAVVERAGIAERRVPEMLLNAVEGSFAPESVKRDMARRARGAIETS
jgi:adenosine deaminase